VSFAIWVSGSTDRLYYYWFYMHFRHIINLYSNVCYIQHNISVQDLFGHSHFSHADQLQIKLHVSPYQWFPNFTLCPPTPVY
jgi:hypothetical protein